MSGLKEIENQITKYKEQLREKFNVKKIGIFGSYSRGEERINSDVDILVEFIESPGWEFYDLKEFLEEILGKKVDLITENGLRLQMKDRILNEVIYI
jgi:predicted nucleotidyltransferase